MSSNLKTVRLKARESKRIRQGHPWIYSNEVEMDDVARATEPGEVVTVVDEHGRYVATATFNRNSLISGRVLTRESAKPIDEGFLGTRLQAALELRTRFFATPFYRLAHSEADGLPGLVIDRFANAVVVQFNTAGMERLRDPIIAAIEAVLAPETIVLRNDSSVRELEGLEPSVDVIRGSASPSLELIEGGVTFTVDPLAGQKTGWYFDQKIARDIVAPLCSGRRVLDLFCYAGAFSLRAAANDAVSSLGIDSSAGALSQATNTADANGYGDRCSFTKSDVFAALAACTERKEVFDVVVCDPPAFVKSRKNRAAGLRGYRKLARLAAQTVSPGGVLFTASCSHLADPTSFADEVRNGISAADRSGRIVASGGAGPDHPVHPQLPESAYLKWQLVVLD